MSREVHDYLAEIGRKGGAAGSPASGNLPWARGVRDGADSGDTCQGNAGGGSGNCPATGGKGRNMSGAKHTAGSWEIAGGTNRNGDLFVWPKLKPGEMGGHGIAKVCGEYDDQVQANARLIASAPDLAEALTEIKSALEDARKNQGCTSAHCSGTCHYCANIRRASVALQKAGVA